MLSGRDVFCKSPTGTGKTAAFALPILQILGTNISVDDSRGKTSKLVFDGLSYQTQQNSLTAAPTALVLSPTRELTQQISYEFNRLNIYGSLKVASVYGGVPYSSQQRFLSNNPGVIIATPGRLVDLVEKKQVTLSRAQIFVLDEADQMLDAGFSDTVKRIRRLCSNVKQTLFFSATLNESVKSLADDIVVDPVVFELAEMKGAITECYYIVKKESKANHLSNLVRRLKMWRTLVFCKTRKRTEQVARVLASRGLSVASLHGGKSQNERNVRLLGFRKGQIKILVCTDVAARGLDVKNVSHVVNYDFPYNMNSYVHRIGRTGRAGKKGHSVLFCEPIQIGLLRKLENFLNRKIPKANSWNRHQAVAKANSSSHSSAESC